MGKSLHPEKTAQTPLLPQASRNGYHGPEGGAEESCTHPSVSRLPPVLLPVGPVVVASALPAHWKRNGERAQTAGMGSWLPLSGN